MIFNLQSQVSYPLVINGIKICSYIADFVYQTPDGVIIIEDVKGIRTTAYKLKKKLIKAVYGVDIVEFPPRGSKIKYRKKE